MLNTFAFSSKKKKTKSFCAQLLKTLRGIPVVVFFFFSFFLSCSSVFCVVHIFASPVTTGSRFWSRIYDSDITGVRVRILFLNKDLRLNILPCDIGKMTHRSFPCWTCRTPTVVHVHRISLFNFLTTTNLICDVGLIRFLSETCSRNKGKQGGIPATISMYGTQDAITVMKGLLHVPYADKHRKLLCISVDGLLGSIGTEWVEAAFNFLSGERTAFQFSFF